MNNKHEGIYLWLLEQDRQKNRSRALRENERSPAVQSPSYSPDPPFDNGKSHENQALQESSENTIDVEQLFDETASLEEESNRLDEEQKKLSLQLKTLSEKTIQEMKKRNRAKQQAVTQLRAKVNKLETLLEELASSEARSLID